MSEALQPSRMIRSCCHDAIDQCPYSRCHTASHRSRRQRAASWNLRILKFFRTSSAHPNPPGLPKEKWWSQTGSNRRPHACKARALPTELWPHQDGCHRLEQDALDEDRSANHRPKRVVGLGRLERPTSPLSGVRSNHLSYRPETAPHHKALPCGVKLVREERETKTAVSRKCQSRTFPSLAG